MPSSSLLLSTEWLASSNWKRCFYYVHNPWLLLSRRSPILSADFLTLLYLNPPKTKINLESFHNRTCLMKSQLTLLKFGCSLLPEKTPKNMFSYFNQINHHMYRFFYDWILINPPILAKMIETLATQSLPFLSRKSDYFSRKRRLLGFRIGRENISMGNNSSATY